MKRIKTTPITTRVKPHLRKPGSKIPLAAGEFTAAATIQAKCTLVAYSNNDQAMLAWQYDKTIRNCIGFSIFRKHEGEADALAEPLNNKVGFAGEASHGADQHRSTEWPIQRFTWVDFTVNKGDVVRYKIVPIVIDRFGNLVKDERNASEWTSPVSINTGDKYQAYFNRGVIS